MPKELKIDGNNLIITIPRFARRYNPYQEQAVGDGDAGEMKNIVGLYEDEYKNGLAYAIDMDYKGKGDQCTDYFYKLDGTKKEFEAMCKELAIDIHYSPDCPI